MDEAEMKIVQESDYAKLFEWALAVGKTFDRDSWFGKKLEISNMKVLAENIGERNLTIFMDEGDDMVLVKTPGSDWLAAWLEIDGPYGP